MAKSDPFVVKLEESLCADRVYDIDRSSLRYVQSPRGKCQACHKPLGDALGGIAFRRTRGYQATLYVCADRQACHAALAACRAAGKRRTGKRAAEVNELKRYVVL